jgi:hypothetical protein
MRVSARRAGSAELNRKGTHTNKGADVADRRAVAALNDLGAQLRAVKVETVEFKRAKKLPRSDNYLASLIADVHLVHKHLPHAVKVRGVKTKESVPDSEPPPLGLLTP